MPFRNDPFGDGVIAIPSFTIQIFDVANSATWPNPSSITGS